MDDSSALPAISDEQRHDEAVALIASSDYFDEHWYAATHGDAPRDRLAGISHYLRVGAGSGHDPGPQFSTSGYLAVNPDVGDGAINPLVHYLAHGKAEGRSIVAAAGVSDCVDNHIDVLRTSKWFDGEWYLAKYKDIADAAIDPATHYLYDGGNERRDPGPNFSSADYLEAHPDVAQAELNPLLHYILHGHAEGRSLRNIYPRWIAQCERLTSLDRAAISEHIRDLSPGPLISVVVPTFNTALSDLVAMLCSVKRQLWTNWELCVADDCSSLPYVRETLAEFASNDSRIRIVARGTNGGIAAATNSALSIATGDFVALLDHDDVLRDTALYEVAVEIARAPSANLIFSDSDEIDVSDTRSNPYFKLGWNPDVMLGHNLVSHLGVFRRDIVERVGGIKEGFDGSQDYDLALRVVDESHRDQIRHIPSVLYHWRRASTAASFSDRCLPVCIDSARRAVADHLARNGIDAKVGVNPLHPIWSRVIYALPVDLPSVAIIVAVTSGVEGLAATIDDLRARTNYNDVRIVIVADEQVTDAGERDFVSLGRHEFIRIIRRRGFLTPVEASAVGLAACAESDVIIFADANTAIWSSALWLEELVAQVMQPGVAAAGPKVRSGNGHMKDAGGAVALFSETDDIDARTPGYFGLFCIAREVAMLGPTAIAVRTAMLAEVGGLDATIPLLDAAIGDLCGRLRAAGKRLIWTPFAVVEHGPGGGQATRDADPNFAVAQNKRQQCADDSFYNPNLALDAFGVPSFPSRRRPPWEDYKNRIAIHEGQAQRARALMCGVDRNAKIVEVGASYSPVAPRAEGWRTTIIDHARRAELVAKYDGEPNVFTDRIEEVDVVWTGGSIADAVPGDVHGSFDVLVASHMIEHSTDMLGFLKAAEKLLKPDGTIILAVPDKRYCFDFFRPLTTSADIIEAHQESRSRHSWKIGFEHLAYSVLHDGNGAWGQESVGELRFGDRFGDAIGKLEELLASESYSDFHAWKFTPASFQLILLETCALGLCDWQVESVSEAMGCEFHVRLRRGGAEATRSMTAARLDERRMTLLRRSLIETREQLDWALTDSEKSATTALPEKVEDLAPPAREIPSIPLPLDYRSASIARRSRLAVVVHLYHTDLNAEFRDVLEVMQTPYDLFISTADETRAADIRATFHGWGRGEVSVSVFPNRGRDIAAKLVGFRDIYSRYDIVLFLHSKKSEHSIALDGWRHYLMSTLVGSQRRVDGILEMFDRRPSLGIVAAPHFGPISRAIDWGANSDLALDLAFRLGLPLDPADRLDMPSGSMFWARTAALAPLLSLELDFDDFPPEAGQLDGTPAHAIERLFFHACEHAGFDWVKIDTTDALASSAIRSPADLDLAIERAIRPLAARRDTRNVVGLDTRLNSAARRRARER